MLAVVLFVLAWVLAFPVAILLVVAGFAFLSETGGGLAASGGDRAIGILLVVAGIALGAGMVRWFMRMRRGSEAISALPDGERFRRIRLSVGSGRYTSAVRAEGPYGLWLDVGDTNLLIHAGIRYRALVPKERVRAELHRRWWGRRLAFAFDPPAEIRRWGRPFVAERILVPVPEQETALALVTPDDDAGADGDQIDPRGTGLPLSGDRDWSDILGGIPPLLIALVISPWPGYVLGRDIARRLSEDPRVGDLWTYAIAAAVTWVLVAGVLWFGAWREWYDVDEAFAWLLLFSPVLAVLLAIPVGFFITF